MNTDDFEQQIRKQPLRRLPPAWRAEILAAACEAARPSQASNADLLPFWKLVFIRFPVAWGALAAVWGVMTAAHIFVFNPFDPAPGFRAAVNTEESTTVWRLQSAGLRQLTSGDDSLTENQNESDTTPRPPAARPRSEFLRENRFGEHPSGNPSVPIV